MATERVIAAIAASSTRLIDKLINRQSDQPGNLINLAN